MNETEKIEILTRALTGVYWFISEYEAFVREPRFADALKDIHDALELTGQCPDWLK